MKPLALLTRALLDELAAEVREAGRDWFGQAARRERIMIVMDRIGSCSEPGAIRHLCAQLVHASPEIQVAAATAIDRLFQSLPAIEYVGFDRDIRNAYWAGYTWLEGFKPQHMDLFAKLTPGNVGLFGVASMHSNGFVRERAVAQLAAMDGGGREIPFLLVRCNDWVEPVRERALRAMMDRVRTELVGPLIQNLPLLRWLGGTGRAAHGLLTTSVVSLLTKQAARAELLRGMEDSNAQVRRECLWRLLDTKTERATVIEHGLRSRDNVIVLETAQAAVAELEGDELAQLLQNLIRQRSAQLRLLALEQWTQRGLAGADERLWAGVADRSSGVRELSRYCVGRRNPGADFADHYRVALANAKGTAAAIAIDGLGETGKLEDAAVAAGFVDHALPAVRRAVIRTLGRLDPEGHRQPICAAILDNSPAVSRAATAMMQKQGFDLTTGLAEAALAIGRPLHVTRNAMRLLSAQATWESLLLLLRACADAEGESRGDAVKYLANSVANSHQPRGDSDSAMRVARELEPARNRLPDAVVRTIDLMLRTARILG